MQALALLPLLASIVTPQNPISALAFRPGAPTLLASGTVQSGGLLTEVM